MNAWLWAATLLLPGFVPAGAVCLRGPVMERLVGLLMAQVLAILELLLLAEGFGRDIYFDLALAAAILSLASGLVFTRFLERWL